MIDEGYTKFRVDWRDHRPVDFSEVAELDRWRTALHDAGLIGRYPDSGIGFGNISVRIDGGAFLISGTQTGHHRRTDRRHYALVTRADIEANTVACRGAVQASSESLTHAAIYGLDSGIDAVVHVHDAMLWERLLGRLPTTDAAVAYGTPAMARELGRLYRETNLKRDGVAVMAGHESGLVGFGRDLEEAANRILSARRTI